jgi:hypothetical protein
MAPKSFEFQVPSFESLLPSPNAKHETRDTKPKHKPSTRKGSPFETTVSLCTNAD